MSYLDEISRLNKAERQAKFMRVLGFKCYCPSCASPYSDNITDKKLEIAEINTRLQLGPTKLKIPQELRIVWMRRAIKLMESLGIVEGLASLYAFSHR